MNVLVSLILAGLAFWSGIWWIWIVAGVCAAAGGFALYEARKKWCVVRAMGFKTPL
jgi:cell division protein FtsW (lipid II flippase)